MNFSQWLKANNYDEAALSEAQKKHLEAAWKEESRPAEGNEFDKKMQAIEDESRRVVYIQERTATVAAQYRGNPDKVRQLKDLCASAVADQTVDARAYDLSLLRIERALPALAMTPSGEPVVDNTLLEAALCLTHKLPNAEKVFGEQTLQAAHSKFRRGLGLKELLMIAAERNSGYRGSIRDEVALCRAAFGVPNSEYYGGMRADVGPSNVNVPGILSNVANKFLAVMFLYTEQSWREIATIKPANDFKQLSTYRLTGANKFKKVAPGGEIKHGSLSELKYTNQVDTYGSVLGIDRRDIINDDLSAFTGASSDLARGAGDSMNEVFWTEWLDDSTFFPTNKSLANYDDGATDSVLSLAGLENADNIFAAQTKPDGTPLGAMPAILLVPRVLRATARGLMASVRVVGQGDSAGVAPDANIWSEMFRVVTSIYLSSSAIPGSSSTAWYLLAEPGNIAAIEMAFLFGKEFPTVETGEFEFDRLGLGMRAYMDFGCKKQEPRAGVKLKGAA